MGNWTRIHIDDNMSAAQLAIFEKMFPVAFAGFDLMARSRARVPLNPVRTDSIINFTVPESAVELTLMPGLADERIVINGLPNPPITSTCSTNRSTTVTKVRMRHGPTPAPMASRR